MKIAARKTTATGWEARGRGRRPPEVREEIERRIAAGETIRCDLVKGSLARSADAAPAT
jgi:hypothetical protein